ncbi:hypothetical protein F5Y00DRAFT_259198 [Daldinia vernicosa]|uniref:uncharacterized protein n=1 Tax=Daldinia vernicosa TaxID=114800 RepID=UPI002008E0F7|nr:uncharacterized protein F5Y00DRAFT_259198 [Daldinia vernicosa]KAI0851708.1 hypothetical protein F5Y00DRAFT_259198 [Daldinia vernicosa]
MARTWENVFESYIASKYKDSGGLDLSLDKIEITSKRDINSFIGTWFAFLVNQGRTREFLHNHFREFFEWVYYKNLSRHNAKRLAALGNRDACINFPTVQEYEEAIAKKEANKGLVIRRPVTTATTRPAATATPSKAPSSSKR